MARGHALLMGCLRLEVDLPTSPLLLPGRWAGKATVQSREDEGDAAETRQPRDEISWGSGNWVGLLQLLYGGAMKLYLFKVLVFWISGISNVLTLSTHSQVSHDGLQTSTSDSV